MSGEMGRAQVALGRSPLRPGQPLMTADPSVTEQVAEALAAHAPRGIWNGDSQLCKCGEWVPMGRYWRVCRVCGRERWARRKQPAPEGE